MQAMSWGATDCTGYVKMLNKRNMNHITGFRKVKVVAQPLATTGFRFHKKKAPSWH